MREELYDIARNVASVGYYAMVPDLYYRQGKIRDRNFFDVEGRTISFEALDDKLREYALAPAAKTSDEMVMADTASLIEFVADDKAAKQGPMVVPVIASAAALVLRAAGNFPERIRAAASLHGSELISDKPDSPHLVAAKAKGEIYSGFGERDWFSPPKVIATMVGTLSNVPGLTYCHTVITRRMATRCPIAMFTTSALLLRIGRTSSRCFGGSWAHRHRHCEGRSDEAIQWFNADWIASPIRSQLCMFTNSLIDSSLREGSMRDNSYDRTIERNYVQKWRFLMANTKR